MIFYRKASASWLAGASAAGVFVLIAIGIGALVWGLARTSERGPDETVVAESPSPTQFATPTSDLAELIQVDGPLSQEEAISQANLSPFALYVADVTSASFYVLSIEPLLDKGFLESSSWLDDDTLLLSFNGRCDGCPQDFVEAFAVSLDGSVRDVEAAQPATQTPSRLSSVDGEWSAEQQPGQFGGVIVTSRDGRTSYRVTNAFGPRWSPTESRLAVLGNVCVGFDALTFDPSSAKLTNLTESQPIVFDLLWRPDGTQIAVNVIDRASMPSEGRIIGLINVDTGGMETIVNYEGLGDFPLTAWSPNGSLLLFGYNAGRGACESLADPAVPTPLPSRVEIVAQ
jgi:hypothetical protein